MHDISPAQASGQPEGHTPAPSAASAEAFFTARGNDFIPLSASASSWSEHNVRGPAITGLLAGAAERARETPGLRPAKASFDLFRPTRMAPLTVRTDVVRSGRRITLIDSFLVQDDTVTARAQVQFLAVSTPPDGRLWEPGCSFAPPPKDLRPDEAGRLYRSGGDWSAQPEEHDGDERMEVWQTHRAVVAGEAPSAFMAAATATDMTSMTIHWSDHGIQYINSEATLAMARPPVGSGIGVTVTMRMADAGVSAGSGVLFDEHGPFAVTTVTALANAQRSVRSVRSVGNDPSRSAPVTH